MSYDKHRETFFKVLFSNLDGFICIARLHTRHFIERYFNYPADLDACLAYIQKYADTDNLWYCAQLLDRKKRNKHNVISYCSALWADLDECPPDVLKVEPTVLIQSSPGRFQAIWSLKEPIPSEEASHLSKKIAYFHEADGADISGWDLSQLLRVPYTYNMKYDEKPAIKVVSTTDKEYTLVDFAEYPEPPRELIIEDRPIPERTETGEMIMNQYDHLLARWDWDMFFQEPESDWSSDLWKFENRLLELGLPTEDVYVICRDAACNKYARDKDKRPHPELDLWREILRVEAKQNQGEIPEIDIPELETKSSILEIQLVSEEERDQLSKQRTIIEDYIDWASTETDAPPEFHLGGILVILSHLLADRVVIPYKSQTMKVNLWVMLLADTTMNRKSTTMGLATDLLREIDEDAIVANDATWEGLFSAMKDRGPNRPSIFERDDFQGLLQQMSLREYYSGLANFLTKMYDGKTLSRKLRKESITVVNPILGLFVAGGLGPILQYINHELIVDGFLPRFIFIKSQYDPSRIRDFEFGVQPGTTYKDLTKPRRLLYNKLYTLYRHYQDAKEKFAEIKDHELYTSKIFHCHVASGTVELYNSYERTLQDAAFREDQADFYVPMLDRFCKSGLKLSAILAALRMEDTVTIQPDDVRRAFYYLEPLIKNILHVVDNCSLSTSEHQLRRAMSLIRRNSGVPFSKLLTNLHLMRRQGLDVVETLEARALIKTDRNKNKDFYLIPIARSKKGGSDEPGKT